MIDPTDQLEKQPAHTMLPHPTDLSEFEPAGKHVVLAHDWLVGLRGGERVLDQIAQTLDAMNATTDMLYTMFDAGTKITPRIDQLNRTVSKLNAAPKPLRRWLLSRYPGAIESLSTHLNAHHDQQPIDLLISSSSAAVKSIRAPKGVPHLCYCHTPARYLWSQSNQYTQGGIKARARALGLKIYGRTLRVWDARTADNVDRFIANSTHTQSQIREHYNRESTVIHPPVDTGFFTPDQGIVRDDALLLVSALEPYKRVDLAIDAALISGRPLNIIGTGSHESTLRRHARRANRHLNSKQKINFMGSISNEELRVQYRNSAAFLFPQIEDFGITAVEAQACGCPVVARATGGALDTVIEDQTGRFFEEPSPDALAHAIEHVPTSPDTPNQCTANATRFSIPAFQSKMQGIIQSVLEPDRDAPSIIILDQEGLINIEPLAVSQDRQHTPDE